MDRSADKPACVAGWAAACNLTAADLSRVLITRQREKAEAELRDEEAELLVRQQQIEEAIARRQETERRRQSRQIGYGNTAGRGRRASSTGKAYGSNAEYMDIRLIGHEHWISPVVTRITIIS